MEPRKDMKVGQRARRTQQCEEESVWRSSSGSGKRPVSALKADGGFLAKGNFNVSIWYPNPEVWGGYRRRPSVGFCTLCWTKNG